LDKVSILAVVLEIWDYFCSKIDSLQARKFLKRLPMNIFEFSQPDPILETFSIITLKAYKINFLAK
jgi:hypothetical protein